MSMLNTNFSQRSNYFPETDSASTDVHEFYMYVIYNHNTTNLGVITVFLFLYTYYVNYIFKWLHYLNIIWSFTLNNIVHWLITNLNLNIVTIMLMWNKNLGALFHMRTVSVLTVTYFFIKMLNSTYNKLCKYWNIVDFDRNWWNCVCC